MKVAASSPAFKHAQRVEFAGAAEGNDQQEATDEAADDSSRDDSGGDDDGTALLVTTVSTVVLSVANPRLKHAAVILQRSKVKLMLLKNICLFVWVYVSQICQYLAVEVPRLTKKAVLFIRTIGAAVLVVAPVRSGVTRSVSGTGELVLLTRRTVQLIPTVGTVPVAIAALLLRVTAPVPPTGNLPGQAEPIHLKNTQKDRLNTTPEKPHRSPQSTLKMNHKR